MSIRIHLLLGWALVIVTLALIGFLVPGAEQTIGSSYLIFFFHFPSAVNCLNFFLLAGVLSLVYLVRGRPRLDFWAAAAVEVGVLACTITLVTGSIWARAAWGLWWDATDPRLMTVAVMWLTYAGYLALRGTVDEPVKRARFSAVFAVIAAANVPVVYFSIKWFGQSHHPMDIDLGARAMKITQWTGAFAFLILYTAFLRLRFRVHESNAIANRLEEGLLRAGI